MQSRDGVYTIEDLRSLRKAALATLPFDVKAGRDLTKLGMLEYRITPAEKPVMPSKETSDTRTEPKAHVDGRAAPAPATGTGKAAAPRRPRDDPWDMPSDNLMSMAMDEESSVEAAGSRVAVLDIHSGTTDRFGMDRSDDGAHSAAFSMQSRRDAFERERKRRNELHRPQAPAAPVEAPKAQSEASPPKPVEEDPAVAGGILFGASLFGGASIWSAGGGFGAVDESAWPEPPQEEKPAPPSEPPTAEPNRTASASHNGGVSDASAAAKGSALLAMLGGGGVDGRSSASHAPQASAPVTSSASLSGNALEQQLLRQAPAGSAPTTTATSSSSSSPQPPALLAQMFSAVAAASSQPAASASTSASVSASTPSAAADAGPAGVQPATGRQGPPGGSTEADTTPPSSPASPASPSKPRAGGRRAAAGMSPLVPTKVLTRSTRRRAQSGSLAEDSPSTRPQYPLSAASTAPPMSLASLQERPSARAPAPAPAAPGSGRVVTNEVLALLQRGTAPPGMTPGGMPPAGSGAPTSHATAPAAAPAPPATAAYPPQAGYPPPGSYPHHAAYPPRGPVGAYGGAHLWGAPPGYPMMAGPPPGGRPHPGYHYPPPQAHGYHPGWTYGPPR